MSMFTLEVQVPDSLRVLGYSDEEIRKEIPVMMVLKRFRQGTISSGKAAQLLNMTRRDFLDLLSLEGIPLFDPSESELDDEIRESLGQGIAGS